MLATGGWTLADHVNSPNLLGTLQSSKWDYVILQEHSQFPAVEEWRNQTMYPAARTLVGDIRGAGANPIFFQTWARRDGMPENGMVNFESMQYEVNMGYAGIAQELNAPIAPVGNAWFNVTLQHPSLQLWQEDGNHPTELGTYLAACVFYALIFQESPQGLSYVANLSEETAQQLQEIGAGSVLTIP